MQDTITTAVAADTKTIKVMDSVLPHAVLISREEGMPFYHVPVVEYFQLICGCTVVKVDRNGHVTDIVKVTQDGRIAAA